MINLVISTKIVIILIEFKVNKLIVELILI